jgi:putative acetyltransferase
MSEVLVRDELIGDKALIFGIHAAAFPADDEARLVDRLREDGDLVISLIAAVDETPVGHVAFSRMIAPFGALGLAPVGVLPDLQRRGIGEALIRSGLDRARHLGWEGAFVLGDTQYYERFGFSSSLASGFACRFAGAHLMAIALNGGSLPQLRGDVSYAAAFDALD